MKLLSWSKMPMLAAVVAVLLMSTATGQTGQSPENPLLSQIRKEFQRVNPGISEVSILEVAPFRYWAPVRKYVLIAYGIKDREPVFRGNFWDEVFGFFVADGKLMGIESTFDIVPTPRWRDYRFKIGRVSDDSVIIRGAGDTYGDGPKELKFKWNPFKAQAEPKQ